jgi:hypothetical protein
MIGRAKLLQSRSRRPELIAALNERLGGSLAFAELRFANERTMPKVR